MMRRSLISAAICWAMVVGSAQAGEPALPAGLGGGSEPSLPSGLSVGSPSSEPVLPMGLGDGVSVADGGEDTFSSDNWREILPFDLTGFAEVRYGRRITHDRNESDVSIAETRLQLQAEKSMDWAKASLTADFLYDPVLDEHTPDLEEGEGWLDLREANLLFRPTDFADVKVGRQVLTWGTGDLIFINDLFPKDWNAFFIGRDVEYLKAPSDALKIALFSDAVNLDIVYTPRFDPDRYIDGERLSYFNQGVGTIVGQNMPVRTLEQNEWFSEDELALRLHRLVGAYETALYLYNGYWKSPNGQDPLTGLFTFPRLSVYGASLRGPLGSGIANAEIGYYDSRDDNGGANPFVRNSEWRFLTGYEQEIVPELTGAVQYYVEHMVDYSAYLSTLPTGAYAKDETRHVITMRLTKLMLNQNLTLSLFNFWSPSDEDGYLRPNVNYKLDDHWQVEAGGNVFYGRKDPTFFGQFRDNSNLYAAARYSF